MSYMLGTKVEFGDCSDISSHVLPSHTVFSVLV